MSAGTIIKRGNGHGAKITIGGKQLWIATFDERDHARVSIDRTVRSPHPTLTVDTLIEKWTNRPDIDPETNKHNRQMLAEFSRRHGSRPAASFIRLEAVGWTQRHFPSARYVKALFEYGVKIGVCEDNPFAGLTVTKKSKVKVCPTPAQVKTAAEVALAHYTDQRALLVHDLILVSSQTGLRLHEVAGLTPGNVVVDGGSVRLQLIGKHQTFRVVPVPESIAHIVQRRSANPLLFGRLGKKLTRQAIHRLMKPVREKAGLPDMNFHLLRHHYATELANRGVQDRDAAFAMWGHGNTRLLKEVYAHPDREAATRRIEEVLNGS